MDRSQNQQIDSLNELIESIGLITGHRRRHHASPIRGSSRIPHMSRARASVAIAVGSTSSENEDDQHSSSNNVHSAPETMAATRTTTTATRIPRSSSNRLNNLTTPSGKNDRNCGRIVVSSPAISHDGNNDLVDELSRTNRAIQDLQCTVETLLVFRDFFMEVMMPTMRPPSSSSQAMMIGTGGGGTAFNNLILQQQQQQQSTSELSSSSPSRWEPGIKVKRKLGGGGGGLSHHHHQRNSDAAPTTGGSEAISVSSSSFTSPPRYRSNSQGNGKMSAINSVVQDSGFCAESSSTSSSGAVMHIKDHHSSAITCTSGSSGRASKSQMDDELFSLLEYIQNKGNRLKLEVDFLTSSRNNKKYKLLSSSNHHSKRRAFAAILRRCRSLDDLKPAVDGDSSDNYTHTNSRADNVAVTTADGCGNFNTLRSSFLEAELSKLKCEREMLLKKMSDIESENMANVAHTNRLLQELQSTTEEKRQLEEKFKREQDMTVAKAAANPNNFLMSRTLPANCWKSTTSNSNAVNTNVHQSPLVKGQLMNLMQVFKDNSNKTTNTTPTTSTSPTSSSNSVLDGRTVSNYLTTKNATTSDSLLSVTSKESYYTPDTSSAKVVVDAISESHLNDHHTTRRPESTKQISRPSNPVTRELMQETTAAFSTAYDQSSLSLPMMMIDETSVGDDNSSKPDILKGLSSGHLPPVEKVVNTTGPGSAGGVTLNREKVLSILKEYDPTTLHRFLLNLTYQIEALNAHSQRLSMSRATLYDKLVQMKAENEDLKFQLEERNIQLEGTKAKVRVLERMKSETTTSVPHTMTTPVDLYHLKKARNSADDESKTTSTSASQFTTSTPTKSSENGCLTPMSTTITKYCARSPISANLGAMTTGCSNSGRRSISKIPLKTNSAACGNNATITSPTFASKSSVMHAASSKYSPNKLSSSTTPTPNIGLGKKTTTMTSFRECAAAAGINNNSSATCISYSSSTSSANTPFSSTYKHNSSNHHL